jgi:hypothetical protein
MGKFATVTDRRYRLERFFFGPWVAVSDVPFFDEIFGEELPSSESTLQPIASPDTTIGKPLTRSVSSEIFTTLLLSVCSVHYVVPHFPL